MGVLRCSRGDCDNIMCDRISDEYGYICDECFDELVSMGITANIDEFMTSKKKKNNPPIDVKGYIEKIFVNR